MPLYRTIDAHYNGVQSGNSASVNATALQALIDDNTANGATIWFSEPVPMDPITLKSNVFLQGNNRAAYKGSKPNAGASASLSATPSGAAFLITNTGTACIKMQSNTGIDGFIFHYPSQVWTAATIGATTTYPATITKDSGAIEGISLTNLCFTGATTCMSFVGDATNFMADMIVDKCYGYPLGGNFLRVDFALDIPRVTRCHVNPGVGFQFLGDANGWANVPVKQALNNDIVTNANIGAFAFTSTDELQVSQCFVYGQYLGFDVTSCYGALVDCNTDVNANGFRVSVGAAHKYISLIGCNAIPGVASGYAYIFGGAGGVLKMDCCHAFTPVNAADFLIVNGTGVQNAVLTNCTYSTSGGSWAHGVNATNGSAVVTGSAQAV